MSRQWAVPHRTAIAAIQTRLLMIMILWSYDPIFDTFYGYERALDGSTKPSFCRSALNCEIGRLWAHIRTIKKELQKSQTWNPRKSKEGAGSSRREHCLGHKYGSWRFSKELKYYHRAISTSIWGTNAIIESGWSLVRLIEIVSHPPARCGLPALHVVLQNSCQW